MFRMKARDINDSLRKFLAPGILGVGILLLFSGIFIVSGFVEKFISSFGYDTGEMQDIRVGIYFLGALSVLIGMVATFISGMSLLFPVRANRFFNYISRFGALFQSRLFYWSFCFAYFIFALLLGMASTRSGPGITPDSVFYISAGENVYHGNGFVVSIIGEQYNFWPPMYPLLIAAFMNFGVDAEQAARFITILSSALLVFPLFFLGKILCNSFAGYAACLICLLFMPLTWATSLAMTEMTYIFFSVLVVLLLVVFIDSKNTKTELLLLSAGGFLTALAILTRYTGLILLPVGLAVILFRGISRLKTMIYQAVIYVLLSILPVLFWLYRNLTVTDSLIGPREPRRLELLANARQILNSIPADFFGLGDFTRVSMPPLLPYIGLIITAACLILLGLYAETHSENRKAFLGFLRKNYLIILFPLAYFIALIIIRYITYFDGVVTRLNMPVYPFLILASASFVIYACKNIDKSTLRPMLIFAIVVFYSLYLTLQASMSLVYIQSAGNGLGFNSPFWRNNKTIEWTLKNVPEGSLIYSNSPWAVSYKLKRPVGSVPLTGNEIEAEEFFRNLQTKRDIYIISYKNHIHTMGKLMTDNEISGINQKYHVMSLEAEFPESTIWRSHN